MKTLIKTLLEVFRAQGVRSSVIRLTRFTHQFLNDFLDRACMCAGMRCCCCC